MERSDINVDSEGNTVLHLAARLAPRHELSRIPNYAFQMQYELRRFKEVEKLVSPLVRGLRNADGKTADMIFADEHEELKIEAKQWIKRTVSGFALMSMAVSTTFVITECNKLLYGISPADLESWEYKIMAISDVIGMCTCTISLFAFASIRDCSFDEDDFLYYMPKEFCIGLACLNFSIWLMFIVTVTYFIANPGQSICGLLVVCVSMAAVIKRLSRQSLCLLFWLAFGKGNRVTSCGIV